MFCVTARPEDQLWLIALLDSPRRDAEGWQAPRNKVPITDITALIDKLRFANGKGLKAKPGRLSTWGACWTLGSSAPAPSSCASCSRSWSVSSPTHGPRGSWSCWYTSSGATPALTQALNLLAHVQDPRMKQALSSYTETDRTWLEGVYRKVAGAGGVMRGPDDSLPTVKCLRPLEEEKCPLRFNAKTKTWIDERNWTCRPVARPASGSERLWSSIGVGANLSTFLPCITI